MKAPRPRRPEKVPGDFKDGVITFHLRNWEEFYSLMAQAPSKKLVWRGQSHDWPLSPKIERDREPRKDYDWRSMYVRQLARFKRAVVGRRGANPKNLDGAKGTEEENDEWWALGQHYGLQTPLLDWTRSPFAALFFAFVEEGDATEPKATKRRTKRYRYVYSLNYGALNAVHDRFTRERAADVAKNPEPVPKHDTKNARRAVYAQFVQKAAEAKRLYVPKIRVVDPLTDENARLLSQGGLFTQAPPGVDIERFIHEQFAGSQQIAMSKIAIPDVDRRACLDTLDSMAINSRTIFPDIFGASAYSNLFIDDLPDGRPPR